MSPFRLGLTGSIGMGKSTIAQLFGETGCALWDADAAVHRLYTKGSAAITSIKQLFPMAVIDGSVSRKALRAIIASNPESLQKLETIIHPLVRQDRIHFASQRHGGVVVFDIPLLFETHADAEMDAVACVDVDPETQAARVLARPGMNHTLFKRILARQIPNQEKCRRSDFVIHSDTLDHARAQVDTILKEIEKRKHA